MIPQIGDLVRDKTTGARYIVVSEIRPSYRVECQLVGTRELFLKFVVDLVKESEVTEEPTQIDATLAERGKRYGKFKEVSETIQGLKSVMHTSRNWVKLTASQKESLDMIQHKIARMLNGDPTYEDNAVDIVGYATLMLKNMQGDLDI